MSVEKTLFGDIVAERLARTLRDVRALRGYSLRKVEKATGISNAYLSQLERGEAENPSPDKLKALADFYQIHYMDLMRDAGYISKSADAARGYRDVGTVQAALMGENLTPEEQKAVVEYIKFLRFRNKS